MFMRMDMRAGGRQYFETNKSHRIRSDLDG